MKWVLGCLGLAAIIVCVVVWMGVRKMREFTDQGPVAREAIHAPAERVFASMADADSMSEWRTEGLGIRAPHKGVLAVGDTVEVQSNSRNTRTSRMKWVVTAVTPGALFAMEAVNDTAHSPIFTRRDSLVTVGDSTIVFSTFASPMLAEMAAKTSDSSKAGSVAVGFGGKMMVSAMRLQAGIELKKLKTRIEGGR